MALLAEGGLHVPASHAREGSACEPERREGGQRRRYSRTAAAGWVLSSCESTEFSSTICLSPAPPGLLWHGWCPFRAALGAFGRFLGPYRRLWAALQVATYTGEVMHSGGMRISELVTQQPS